MNASAPRLGYIGLGIMGQPMCLNLLKAGHRLTVWNRSPQKLAPVLAAGADAAAGPAALAGAVDVLFLNVTDTPDVEALLFGDAGVAAGAKPGLVVVDHSTISPTATRDFARRLAQQGVTLLDAPVSGGDVGARNGTLSIMVGGDESAFERVKPVLAAMGKTIARVGGSGAGQACKACNQVAVLGTLSAVCEAIALARGMDLDPQKMIEVVAGGAGGSWQLQNLGPRIVKGDFAPGFMVDLALKDMAIVLEAAAAAGLSLPAARLAEERLAAVKATVEGGGRQGTQGMAQVVGHE